MKLQHVMKLMVLGLALLPAASAFAATKHSLNLQDTVSVSGQQLPAGDYNVSWEGTGSTVEIKFTHGKNVVARTTGRILDLDYPSVYDSAVVMKNNDGSRVLAEIHFRGKKQGIALGEPAGEMRVGNITK